MDIATKKQKLFGRTVLTATPPSNGILDAAYIGKVLNDVMSSHEKNAKEIQYLIDYYRGNQPILQRTKEIRPEIKATIVENRAYEVIASKLGYEFANELQLINVGKGESSPIETLNAFSRLDGKPAKDIDLAEFFYVCGTAYRICLPNKNVTEDDAPYFTDILNPASAFVVYSSEVGNKKLFAGTYTKVRDVSGEKPVDKWKCGVYTETAYFEWTFDNKQGDFVENAPENKPNTLGMIPIIEYPLNNSRLGYIELCIELFDALNTIGSNRIDAIEQFVQSLLVFINCKLPENDDGIKYAPKTGDAIDVMGVQGAPADVKYLTAELNQNEAQTLKQDMLNAIYEITGTPNRKTQGGSTGGDTGQAVSLRDGWAAAESRAKTTEKMFKRSESEYLRIVLKICRDTIASSDKIGDITLMDIDTQFIRNRTDNLLVKAQSALQLKELGLAMEDVLSAVELFGDSIAVAARAEDAKTLEDEQSEASEEIA